MTGGRSFRAARTTRAMRPIIVLAMLTLALGGCASAARVTAMVPTEPSAVSLPVDSPLREGLSLEGVMGGEETNPLWTSEVSNTDFREALRQALVYYDLLYQGDGKSSYSLRANFISLDQPLMGFDLTVTSVVEYRIKERATGDLFFEETVTAPYTATVSDAFLAVERLRLANEGSIKENIGKFIKRLVKSANPGG